MISSNTIDKIRHALNQQYVRRLLIKYFVTKGIDDSFDRLVYPATLYDMPMLIPEMADKIEVEPVAIEINPMNNTATLGWNLYVLGSSRMYLGETYHNNLVELAKQLKDGRVLGENSINSTTAFARKQVTPNRIIKFMTYILGRSDRGFVDPTNINKRVMNQPKMGAMGNSPYFTAPRVARTGSGI